MTRRLCSQDEHKRLSTREAGSRVETADAGLLPVAAESMTEPAGGA